VTGAAIARVPSAGGLSISESVAAHGAGTFIFVSGAIPLDDEGQVATGSFRDQAVNVFGQLERAVERAGARLADVIKLTVFLTDFGGMTEVNTVRAELFGAHPPASSAIEVARLFGGAQLEIEAVAFKERD
jgi:2-iminobutanoate/2-iminopropanoate deaminase